MPSTALYAAVVFVLFLLAATAVRAVVREARNRQASECEQVLREHPELAEIVASTWGP